MSILHNRTVARLLGASLVARLMLPFFGVGLLIDAQRLTGSYAAAGVVTGVYAISVGLGGPGLGRLIDGRGQTPVLAGAAILSALLFVAAGLLPAGTSPFVLIALAAAAGLATPPLVPCLRTILPDVVDDADALRAAYALDAAVTEGTWIAGPPLGLAVAGLWSPGAALAAGGVVLLVGTCAFAAQSASRRWHAPHQRTATSRRTPLGDASVRSLVLVAAAMGLLFGAAELGVTAVATSHGGASAAAPLLALWGVGGLLGGLAAGRLGGGARDPRGLALVLTGLAGGHLALALTTDSLASTAIVLILAGTAIAPTYATLYSMVEQTSPAETLTEAFAWLAASAALGNALGTAIAGTLLDGAGPAAVFVFAGIAGAAAVVVTVLNSCTITDSLACSAA
jgi:predicted MFS family arabinose efflux permease